MASVVLVATGTVVVVAAVVLAYSTRPRGDEPLPDPRDPWAALAPRPVEEVEREGRVRLWPIAAVLAGVVMILGGLVSAQTPDRSRRPPRPAAPSPLLIELAVPSPSPSPQATPSPPPTASAAPAPSPSPTARPSARPRATPTASPRPTATPAPRAGIPGPNVSTSSSCSASGSAAHLSITYRVTARPGTTIASVTVYLDGSPMSPPDRAGGSTSYANTRTRTVPHGPHTFEVVARGSDGGVTTRTTHLNC